MRDQDPEVRRARRLPRPHRFVEALAVALAFACLAAFVFYLFNGTPR